MLLAILTLHIDNIHNKGLAETIFHQKKKIIIINEIIDIADSLTSGFEILIRQKFHGRPS